MYSFALLQWHRIDGFEYDAEVICVVGASDDIIGQIINFYFFIFLCINYMILSIEQQFLLFPYFEIVAASVRIYYQKTSILYLWTSQLVIN
jgi:hypothetical protein